MIIVGTYLMRAITRSLDMLTKAMKKIAYDKGGLEYRLENVGNSVLCLFINCTSNN